jgi:hypothetical protein
MQMSKSLEPTSSSRIGKHRMPREGSNQQDLASLDPRTIQKSDKAKAMTIWPTTSQPRMTNEFSRCGA